MHGAHDRARVPSHCIGIEIEAATAFGTGHHGTTRGCLLALDALARRRQRPRHILDLGTGSGVLAIAAAKLFRVPVLATDIDPRAVANARDNARLNGVGALVTVVHARGLRAPESIKRAPFDLVMANILLRPLQRLAAPVARQLMPNARVVLSGILAAQAERGARRLPVAGAGAGTLVRAGRLGDAGDGGAVGLNAADHLCEWRICHSASVSSQRSSAPRGGDGFR